MPSDANDYQKYKCLASPNDEMRGFIIRKFRLEQMASDGQLPSGSVWNDGDSFFQIEGAELEKQDIIEVSEYRLKLLVSRFPVLRFYV